MSGEGKNVESGKNCTWWSVKIKIVTGLFPDILHLPLAGAGKGKTALKFSCSCECEGHNNIKH